MKTQTRRVWSKLTGVFLSLVTAAVFATTTAAQSASAEVQARISYLRANPPATAVGQSVTLLPDGRWLLLGGEDADGKATRAAIILDAESNQSTTVDPMLTTRDEHTATLLPDGTVLVIGGFGEDGRVISEPEVFEPRTLAFHSLANLDLLPRAMHTATLLTDGRLLIVGGIGSDGTVVNDVELFDSFSGAVERFDAGLETARFGHLAVLLPSAPVFVSGGLDSRNQSAMTPELFDPQTERFGPLDRTTEGYLPDAASELATPVVTGTHPDPAADIPLDATLALRFSKPLDVRTLTSDTVSLIGPNGLRPVHVVAAEAGLLAFITPRQDLNPSSSYTLFVKGAKDLDRREMAFTAIGFHTGDATLLLRAPTQPAEATGSAANGSSTGRASPGAPAATQGVNKQAGGTTDAGQVTVPSADQSAHTEADSIATPSLDCGADSNEAWVPHIPGVAKEGWVAKRSATFVRRKQARVAEAGVTAIAGQILRLNGLPLANVTVRAGSQVTRSDADGLFVLRGLEAGAQVLTVDGSTASCADAQYGYFEIKVTAKAAATVALPFPIWMPKLDTANAHTIPAPTKQEIVLTNPALPGLEVHIPPGTLIRDRAGRIVTRVSITPIPNDRPPYPMPEIADFPVYFTLQPGGARLEGVDGLPRQAQVVYPNYTNFPPGNRFSFWSYDPTTREWHVYGTGLVSEDAQRIVPDPGVGLYSFTGFSIAPDPDPPPCTCDCCDGGGGDGAGGGSDGPGDPADPTAGDPVHTASGQFTHSHTDFRLEDVMPITLRRLHYSGDARPREFGYGMLAGLEMRLYNPHPGNYSELWLVTETGGRVVLTCTGGCESYSTARYVARSDPGYYFNSTMSFVSGNGWLLRTKDGTRFMFYYFLAKLMWITDRYGNTTTYTRANPSSQLMQITSPNGRWLAFTYGGGGLTAVNDNAGRTWTYSYDQYSRLTTATDPEGGQWRYTWPTPNGTAANYRIVSVIDPRQNTMVTNEYDANGRVIKQTYADLTTNQFAYVVDGAGKVTQTDITDRRGTIRRVEFDSTGRVSRNTFALGKPEQQVTTYTREAGTNLLTSMTDALGRRTDYSYDSQGNLLTTTRLAGTTDAVTTKYTYGAYGLVTSIEDPLHHTTLLDYDALGNLTRVTDPDPVSNQTNLTYNSQGQPLTVTNAPNQTITYTYDAGIVASVSDPLSRTAQMFSDAVGRIYGVRDPLGNLTQTVYDALDRVTQTTDPLGNTVRYEYDENGNLRAHVDQKGNRTEYAYDAMNRLTSRKDALLHTESYAYDVASRLQRFTDRKSQVSGFVYDALNRRTQAGFGATIGNPTAYGSTIDYTYDAGNRLIRVNDSQIGVPITRSYDGLDRLTGETTALAAVAFSYDAAGRRQTRTVPGQAMMTYAWDNANRLLSVTQGTHAVAFTYDNVNRRTKVALPNGIDIDYTYDAAGQLTGITYRQGTTTLGDLTYAYDNAGRRISVGGGFARTDLPVTIATTSHNANNQLTQWGAPTLTYDFNGNLTGDGTYSYTWDARSQLIQVQQGVTTIASYQYDAFGRRQQKVVNGTTTQFVYDGKNFVQERDEIGSITADLLTGLGMDEIYARTKGAITSSFLTDHLGTIIAEADANGLIQTNYSYEPYGKTKQNGTASDNSQRYTGREQDTADLYYYRARYYSPSLDRFMAEDPIGLDGGVNPYSYVLGNPLSFADPTGQMSALGIAVCGGAALLAYASYKLYSSYSCQKDCEEDCDKKHKCDQGCPMAEGDTHAHQQCKGACILTCWGGMGKKGPKGPKPTDPPNSPPITPIPVLPK